MGKKGGGMKHGPTARIGRRSRKKVEGRRSVVIFGAVAKRSEKKEWEINGPVQGD